MMLNFVEILNERMEIANLELTVALDVGDMVAAELWANRLKVVLREVEPIIFAYRLNRAT